MSQPWFAIRTSPQREFAVEAMLRKQGIEVFCPTEIKFRKTIKKGRRVAIPVTYAMFVRYCFVRQPFSWLHLMSERHITGVVGFDGKPAAIDGSEIERIRSMSQGSVPYRHSVNPHKALRAGEMAEIAVGPFAGQIVKISGLHGAKARVFLNMFGSEKNVEIEAADLVAA